MDKKIPLVLAGVFLFFISSVLGLILLDKTPEPDGYVQRIIREEDESVFFKKVIDRVPAKANITHPRIDNKTIKFGVSTDSNELNFGIVLRNMSVRKFLNVSNHDTRVKVCVVSYGEISELIEIKPSSLIMQKGDSKEVMLEFKGDRIGYYTGEVDVITKKPKYGFLDQLLSFVPC